MTLIRKASKRELSGIPNSDPGVRDRQFSFRAKPSKRELSGIPNSDPGVRDRKFSFRAKPEIPKWSYSKSQGLSGKNPESCCFLIIEIIFERSQGLGISALESQGVWRFSSFLPPGEDFQFFLLLLRFRKAGRVWCDGARETHWATCHNIVTPSKTKEFLQSPCFFS